MSSAPRGRGIAARRCLSPSLPSPRGRRRQSGGKRLAAASQQAAHPLGREAAKAAASLGDVLPKTRCARTVEVVGLGGKNWVSPSEAEALKSVHLGCFTAAQLLAHHYSIYVSRFMHWRSLLLCHVAFPWSVSRRACKPLCPWLRASAGEARRAGVCDPPT